MYKLVKTGIDDVVILFAPGADPPQMEFGRGQAAAIEFSSPEG